MTREEKINGLCGLKEYLIENPIELEGHKSLPITLIDYAIKALEQEPCEDCISRQATIDKILKWSEKYDDADIRMGFHHALVVLYDMPPVESTKPEGHWIIKEGRNEGYDIAGIKSWYIKIMCDKCGFITTAIEGHTGQYYFCPNCGIKMNS